MKKKKKMAVSDSQLWLNASPTAKAAKSTFRSFKRTSDLVARKMINSSAAAHPRCR